MSAPTTTVADFQDAMLAAVRGFFGDRIKQSGLYSPADEFDDAAQSALKTPCIIIGIEGGTYPTDPDAADPDNRLLAWYDCWAQCWLSRDTENTPQRLPEYAHAMASLVQASRDADPSRRGNRWGLGDAVGWPEDVSADPGEIDDLHGRYAWLVRWRQAVYTDGTLP